jgi:anti-anti-sigma factor
MSIRKRAVRVHQVPEQMTGRRERSFLRDLQRDAEVERPRFVLDCSTIEIMDYATINLLLSCLEEVMKCNGDVRLASLNPEAAMALQLAGVSRLFELYETTDGAVQSFQKRPISLAPLTETGEFEDVSEHAA